MSNGPSAATSRICKKCQNSKGRDAYYKRTLSRSDSVCIECRLADKKKKYQTDKYEKTENPLAPKRIIEPKSNQKMFLDSNRDTATVVQNSDFNDMEKIYGKMTLSQKHEAVQRFNKFITLLREGYSEMLGCEVYVHKD